VKEVEVVVDQEYSDYGGGGMLLLAPCYCSAVLHHACHMHTLT
jgi:hypothetical protein